MGRNTKKARKKITKPRIDKKDVPKFTVDQLLDRVDEYIDSFEYELAQKFCQRALEMEPDNSRVLVTSGILLMEVDEMEKAKQCFGRAIEVEPETGHSKYMYMGQLLTGQDAINCFEKGVELMKKYVEEFQSSQEEGAAADTAADVTPRDISNAYCSMAEIYLTDQCMADDAETRCQGCLDEAVKMDAENPEAYQLYGSFWLSKDDQSKAREKLEKGVSLWLPKWKETENPEGEALDPVELCPLSYPARMNAAKLLIEVQSFEMASEILELLLDEEDEVVEVWYLLGWLNHLRGDDYKGNARYYLAKAKEVAKKTKYDDEEVLKHTDELLESLGPAEASDEEDANADENNDDEDTDSEEEMEH